MNDTKASAAALSVTPPRSAPDSSVRAPTRPARDPTEERARTERLLVTGLAAAIGIASILLPISWSGLWGPYELDVAELARRIGVALHGASQLTLAGQDNRVPTLAELGKGQLPFSCIAAGFQLLGLSDWAGRLPLALWGAIGLLATYVLLARLSERLSAAYAVIVLATMPLYFLQARTLLGDAVTLAAVPLATAGLALATFGSTEQPRAGSGSGARLLWATLGLAGMLAGFASRGALLGVACPALAVGLAWLMLRFAGGTLPARASAAFGIGSLILGALALGIGSFVLFREANGPYLEVLGTRLSEPAKYPSHESVLHLLGFALFPWSAALPFLIGVVLRAGRERAPRENALCLVLLNVFVVALGVHTLMAPYVGHIPFVGVFALAGTLAIAFRDLEQDVGSADRGLGSRLLVVGTATLFIVLALDLREVPQRVLNSFFLGDATFPESFSASSKHWLGYGSVGCLLLLAFALGELPRSAGRGARGREEPWAFSTADGDYRGWLRTLRSAWQGRLLVALLALSAATLVLSSLILIDARLVRIPAIARLGLWRGLLRWSFLLIPCLVALPWLVLLARDLARAFFKHVPIGRVRFAFAGIATFALAISLGYYPALANHLSPRNVFDAYRRLSGPNEPLAVLGDTSNVAPYYARGAIATPPEPKAAMEWLLAGEEARWLVLSSKDLAQLNSLYREHVKPPINLPVVDATSSAVMLATNHLPLGATNQNPLAAWIERDPPNPQHALDVVLEGQLKCLGWSVTDSEGRAVGALAARTKYNLRIHWQVLTAVRGNWKTFVHIDGQGRRLNADHDTLEGRYPFRFWRPQDFVTDVHPFEVEAQFPAGSYQLYFGLFSGNERLKVQRGAHDDNRIAAGEILLQ